MLAVVSSTSYPFPVSSANTRRRGLKAVIGRGPGSLVKPSRITSVQPNQPDCLQFADLISLRPSQLSLPPYSPASTSSNPLRAPFVSPLSRISLSFSNFGSRRIQGHRIFLLPRRNEGRKCFESWKLFGKFVIGYSTNHPDCCLDAICPPYLATFRDLFPRVTSLAHYWKWAFRKNTSPLPSCNARKSSLLRPCPFCPRVRWREGVKSSGWNCNRETRRRGRRKRRSRFE